MTNSPEAINFRPFPVLLGIVLGTVFSISFGLAVVCLVFWILKDEAPRLANEFGPLLVSTGIFTLLSIIAGASFYGSLKNKLWRYLPLACLWVGLFLTGRYYWPE